MDFIQQISWRPGIGDPSIMGWVTVVAYGLAAYAAWAAAGRTARSGAAAPGTRSVWLFVAVLMVFLCINKQLDLQSLLTDIGRVIARNQGWYDDRSRYQRLFAVDVIAVLAIVATLLGFLFREFWSTHRLLAAGLMFLLAFIGIRALSIHHVDALLGYRLAGVKMNWFLELTGIGLVLLAAIRDGLGPQRKPADRSGSNGAARPRLS